MIGPDGGILQGRDAFQDMVFRRLGYEVVHVPFRWSKGAPMIPELQAIVESLKREALDPSTARRVYLEPLKSDDEGTT